MYLRSEYGIILECEVIIAYPGRLALAASTSALVRCRERWISAQFSGRALIIIKRPRPRRPYRYPSTAEIVDPAETAPKRTTSRMGLHQAVGRGEESRAIGLREDVGFESRTPE